LAGEGAQGDTHDRVGVAVREGSEAEGRQGWRGEELEAAMATPGPDLGGRGRPATRMGAAPGRELPGAGALEQGRRLLG
jgi:hypothetical protein